ncbi:M48 metallopeptidase family protein [Nitrosophilus labii]|uniref:M48 metallopeptidase family protein n=1 Tax=Nitrosophilus labii TaxID=2706014 RepID=UPI001657371E|nr:M48 family metallopeptidase [Nitrosophilus labii]
MYTPRRWGSCSSKKNLNFSYRLIMAPKDVIDYVIIHELSHLTYMNHSKYFWTLVSKRCPNYIEYEKWLKDNSFKTLFTDN